jgi:hypothetical protein
MIANPFQICRVKSPMYGVLHMIKSCIPPAREYELDPEGILWTRDSTGNSTFQKLPSLAHPG